MIVNGLTIDNANEVRLGAEWVVRQAPRPILLRGGTWYDPDHRVRFEDRTNARETIPNIRNKTVLEQKGKDSVHASGGVGVSFRHFQVDAGLDVSPRVNTISLSVVYYLR